MNTPQLRNTVNYKHGSPHGFSEMLPFWVIVLAQFLAALGVIFIAEPPDAGEKFYICLKVGESERLLPEEEEVTRFISSKGPKPTRRKLKYQDGNHVAIFQFEKTALADGFEWVEIADNSLPEGDPLHSLLQYLSRLGYNDFQELPICQGETRTDLIIPKTPSKCRIVTGKNTFINSFLEILFWIPEFVDLLERHHDASSNRASLDDGDADTLKTFYSIYKNDDVTSDGYNPYDNLPMFSPISHLGLIWDVPGWLINDVEKLFFVEMVYTEDKTGVRLDKRKTNDSWPWFHQRGNAEIADLPPILTFSNEVNWKDDSLPFPLK